MITVEHPDWMQQAHCHGIGDEFFPEGPIVETVEMTRNAKHICARCPVRAECLQFAYDNDERHGIWGGYTENERRRQRESVHVAVLDIDGVLIERFVRAARTPDTTLRELWRHHLSAAERKLAMRRVVHELRWSRSMIAGRLHMNSQAASRWYDEAMIDGPIELTHKESA